MSRVDDYLDDMSFAMRGTLAEQQTARDELRAHIRDAVREHEISGLSRDFAEAQALADLGDPEAIGRQLRRSRGTAPLQRPLLQPAGALILERRRNFHLPVARVTVALLALSATLVAVTIVYLWPS